MTRKGVYSPGGKRGKNTKVRIEALGKLFSKKDEEIVKLLRGKGLLCPPEKCECGGKLILKEANNTQDGLRMKCSICKSAKSAREGSIFKGIKLPLKKILGVLHQFIIDSGIYAASKNTGVSQKGTTKLFRLFRSLIQRYIDDTQVSIGGDGRIVEVDEVSLGHMQKAMPHEDYRKTKKPKPNYTVPSNPLRDQILCPRGHVHRLLTPCEIKYFVLGGKCIAF